MDKYLFADSMELMGVNVNEAKKDIIQNLKKKNKLPLLCFVTDKNADLESIKAKRKAQIEEINKKNGVKDNKFGKLDVIDTELYTATYSYVYLKQNLYCRVVNVEIKYNSFSDVDERREFDTKGIYELRDSFIKDKFALPFFHGRPNFTDLYNYSRTTVEYEVKDTIEDLYKEESEKKGNLEYAHKLDHLRFNPNMFRMSLLTIVVAIVSAVVCVLLGKIPFAFAGILAILPIYNLILEGKRKKGVYVALAIKNITEEYDDNVELNHYLNNKTNYLKNSGFEKYLRLNSGVVGLLINVLIIIILIGAAVGGVLL